MAGIRKVGVVGCGLMGSGIAQVSAQAGYPTVVREVSKELVDRGLGKIRAFLDKGVEKGKVTPGQRDEVLSRLSGTTEVRDLAGCDIVIEAAVENPDLKKQLFRDLDVVLAPEAIIASNTSSLCITELAAATRRPDRVAGLHFFNPVPLMKLVEVIRAYTTSDATYAAAKGFAQSLGKEPITAPDRPGFVVNRLLVPYLLDAIRVLEAGLATPEDIDKGMKLGCGYPMGPFELLDFVGLDTTLFIAEIMFNEFKDPHVACPPLLRRMVLAGHLGKKSGRGFYRYDERGNRAV